MARSRMQFADIYHYVGRSDSLGIIPCRRLKAGLVKSWRRPISCRSAPDHCFDLRSHAGRTFKPFVSPANIDPILDSSFLNPWLVPACNVLIFIIISIAVTRLAQKCSEPI
jgi:hypothetical protein